MGEAKNSFICLIKIFVFERIIKLIWPKVVSFSFSQMASKRGAGSELTDRNWDQEEEPEEVGTFKQADDSALKQRVIKTAKRRGTSLGAGSSGAFTGFGGFGSSSSSAAAASKPNV